MAGADIAAKKLGEVITRRTMITAPIRAIAGTTVADKMTLRMPEAATESAEQYARLMGPRIPAGKEVIAVQVNGKPVIIGQLGGDYEFNNAYGAGPMVYSVSKKTGLSSDNTDAPWVWISGDPDNANDDAHDYNLSQLWVNATKNGASVVGVNRAQGDIVFLQTMFDTGDVNGGGGIGLHVFQGFTGTASVNGVSTNGALVGGQGIRVYRKGRGKGIEVIADAASSVNPLVELMMEGSITTPALQFSYPNTYAGLPISVLRNGGIVSYLSFDGSIYTGAKIVLQELAVAPATPAAGQVYLYALTDHNVYRKDSTGAATAL